MSINLVKNQNIVMKSQVKNHWANTVLGGAFLVTGTCIGAGMLGLPPATAAGGFIPSMSVFALVWVFMTFTALVMLEVALSNKGETNLISMATKTLGPWGGYIAWITYLLFLYSVMAAYTSGGSTMLASFGDKGSEFSKGLLLLSMVVFTLPFVVMVYKGAKWVDLVNRVLISILILSFVTIVYFMKDHHIGGMSEVGTHPKYLFAAFPLLVTSFGFHLLIPTLKTYLNENVMQLRLAIILGSFVPFGVYFVWEFIAMTYIPTWGSNGLVAIFVNQKNPGEFFLEMMGGSIALKYAIALFSLMALSSSFVGVALGIFDFFADGLKIKKDTPGKMWLCSLTFMPPLLYTFFIPNGFIAALRYAGVFAAILLIIFPVLMAWYRRYHYKQKGCYEVKGGKLSLLMALLFGIGVILIELASQFKWLPVPSI